MSVETIKTVVLQGSAVVLALLILASLLRAVRTGSLR